MKKVLAPVWSETKKGNAIEFEVYDFEFLNGDQNYPVRVEKSKQYFIMDISDEIYDNEDHDAAYEAIVSFLAEKGITDLVKQKKFIVQ